MKWSLAPVLILFISAVLYVLAYAVWINYTATGNYFSGLFEKKTFHWGMSRAIHPSPEFLELFFSPMLWLDMTIGRVSIGVG
jgi:hypothetical protein